MTILGAERRGEKWGGSEMPKKCLEPWHDFKRGTEKDKVNVTESLKYKELWGFKMAAVPESLLREWLYLIKKTKV